MVTQPKITVQRWRKWAATGALLVCVLSGGIYLSPHVLRQWFVVPPWIGSGDPQGIAAAALRTALLVPPSAVVMHPPLVSGSEWKDGCDGVHKYQGWSDITGGATFHDASRDIDVVTQLSVDLSKLGWSFGGTLPTGAGPQSSDSYWGKVLSDGRPAQLDVTSIGDGDWREIATAPATGTRERGC